MTKKLTAALAIGAMLGVAALAPAHARSDMPNRPMMGIMGGGCPMMRMMGRGMMDRDDMPRGMMRGQGMRRGMMRGRGRMQPMADGRLAYLKSEMKITDAQQAAWKEYSDAVKDRVGVMQNVRQTMMETMQDGTAVDRMNARITGMETMLASMKIVKPATEKLYESLSDSQKRVADQLIGMDCGAM